MNKILSKSTACKPHQHNSFKLFTVFSNQVTTLLQQYEHVKVAKTYFKMVVKSVENPEAIVFLVNPYY